MEQNHHTRTSSLGLVNLNIGQGEPLLSISASYLSSTELTNISISMFNFFSGNVEGIHKHYATSFVRAVRAF